MKVKIKTASTLGNASGKVTLRKTCQPVLPDGGRGFLQRWVHGTKRGCHQEEHDRNPQKTLYQHHSAHREDVEKWRAGDSHDRGIENPGFGPQSMIQPTTLMMPGIANDTYAET